MTVASLADTFTAALGPGQVLADPRACAAFAVHGAVPALVVAPASIEELQAALRLAAERRIAVVPWGGGTQQWIGAPLASPRPAAGEDGDRETGRQGDEAVDRESISVSPPRPRSLPSPPAFAVLRTTRLDRVLIYEPDDLTISVEAGMTLGALREHLAHHGQMLPLDPPLPAHATIGGLIATAADGPRRLGYGTLRDLLIGISVVEIGGRRTKAGGMVVKNVSGFDMMKLYLGSFGTLAVVASANFKLLPAPRAAGSLLCRFESAAAAWAFLDALHATQLTPSAAEYLNGPALAEVLAPPAAPDGAQAAIAVRAEGLPAAVERHLRDIGGLARAHGADAQDVPDDGALWARIADLPQTAELADGEAVVKLTALPSDTAALIAAVERLAAARGIAATVTARALNGVIYARLRPVAAADLEALAGATPGLQWVATRVDGGPRWGAPPGLELMRRIKAEFDPLGLLNPGRFLAGL
jgi:glycolate oxidase FAD binding subunit